MPSLVCVTPDNLDERRFCFTDCGPSEGCNPDDDEPVNIDPLVK